MFWNDPSMYGATLYKDIGKELYPREIGLTAPFTSPFSFPNQLTNPLVHPPLVHPWMGVGMGVGTGYSKINTPFVGQQPYGLPQTNFGFAPPYSPWANPMLQSAHVNPYVRPFGYENQFNAAFRPTIW